MDQLHLQLSSQIGRYATSLPSIKGSAMFCWILYWDMTLSDNIMISNTMKSYVCSNKFVCIIGSQEWLSLWPIMWRDVPFANRTKWTHTLLDIPTFRSKAMLSDPSSKYLWISLLIYLYPRGSTLFSSSLTTALWKWPYFVLAWKHLWLKIPLKWYISLCISVSGSLTLLFSIKNPNSPHMSFKL